jgi:tRNA pseudouridine38-40 synthase
MRAVKLLLEYDGTSYQGWQSQRTGCTIQDIISRTLRSITGERIRLTAASRTDAGVHAIGQVAAFSTGSDLPENVLKRALNAKLPPDIRVLSASEMQPTFHPRYDATGKRYYYVIRQSIDGSAFFSRYTWHVRTALDTAAMHTAAVYLSGVHDFSAFRGAGCNAKTTVRAISAIRVSALDSLEFMTISIPGSYIKITVEANAFLRHMVRNIVGTLVEVGRGRIPAGDIPDILASGDRTKAGPTSPASGLFLEKVFY